MILYKTWCYQYEMKDPEPPLDKIVHNRRLVEIGNGWHYDNDQALAHLLWHDRFTKAYMRERENITFDPDRETVD